jgi:uncharacterized repeat protein (TIGR03803 family)
MPSVPNCRRSKVVLLVLFLVLFLKGIGVRNASAAVAFNTLRNIQVDPTSGSTPVCAPIIGSDGALYGMTNQGGANNYGTIYKINVDGSGYTVLHSFAYDGMDGFHPNLSGLIQIGVSLYGTTPDGGRNGGGTIFKINLDGTAYSVICSIDYLVGNSPFGTLDLGSDGALYGTLAFSRSAGTGLVFKVNVNGTGFQVLHVLTTSEGEQPYAGVIHGSDGTLYGTTFIGGANHLGSIFRMASDGTGFSVLKSFTINDGLTYINGLTLDSSATKLFGTTTLGGSGNSGTIYSIGIDGSNFQIIHSFNNAVDGSSPEVIHLLVGADGALYGSTVIGLGAALSGGTVFKVNMDGTFFTILKSFSTSSGLGENYPQYALTQATDGTLYGVTQFGGASNLGSLFKLKPDGSGYGVVHSFSNGTSDGFNPGTPPIIGADGFLYGTTVNGGAANNGAVYRMKTDGSNFSLLHSFRNDKREGFQVLSKLYQAGDGTLYGTCNSGGNVGGTIYKMNSDGSGFKIIYIFDYTNGAFPEYSGVLQGSDGALYGSCVADGVTQYGLIYRINVDGTGFQVLHVFGGSTDGKSPNGNLIQGADSFLYGIAESGGTSDIGTIYKMHLDGSAFQIIHTFAADNVDGSFPRTVIQAADGLLYGTTWKGGTLNYGTIFRLSTDGSGYAILHNFDYTNGGYASIGGVTQSGALYGTTDFGGPSFGCLFGMNTDGSAFTVIHSFKATGINNPYPTGVTVGTDGTLYGVTECAGSADLGTIYSVSGLGVLDHFDLNLNNSELATKTFTGINTLRAANSMDLAIPFNASADSVKVSANAPLTGTITGLGSTQTDTLDRSSDFVAGVADLTAAGMTYTGVVGTSTFTATATVSHATGTSNNVTITIVKTNQSITFGAIPNQTYGAAAITLTASSDSGLPITYTVVSGPATVNGNSLTITGAGSVQVEASQPGNAFLTAATPVDRSFTVQTALLSITANNFTRSFGIANPTFTARYNGFVNSDAPASLSGALALTTSATSSSPVGSYAIHASGQSSPNYTISYFDGTLDVTIATATVSFGGLSVTYNALPRPVTVTTVPANISTAITYNGSPTAPTNAGSYAVSVTVTDPNYTGSTTGTLVISSATPVITWSNPAAIFSGTPLTAAQLDATSNVAGTFMYAPPLGTTLPLGNNQILTAFFTPADLSNFNPVAATVSIDVLSDGPAFTSQPFAFPNPAVVNQEILFIAAANTPKGGTLTYIWDFGDGATATGGVITHTYAVANIYLATIAVTDAAGQLTTGHVVVKVGAASEPVSPAAPPPPPPPLTNTVNTPFVISNADGIPDQMKNAANLLGITSVGPQQLMAKVGLSIKLNFAKSNEDSITVTGTLVRPELFKSHGAPVVIDIGGVFTTFTLNTDGIVNTGANSFAIGVKGKLATTSRFTITLRRGNFATALAGHGLTNSNVLDAAVTIPVGVIINNQLWVSDVPRSYRARHGIRGATFSR